MSRECKTLAVFMLFAAQRREVTNGIRSRFLVNEDQKNRRRLARSARVRVCMRERASEHAPSV